MHWYLCTDFIRNFKCVPKQAGSWVYFDFVLEQCSPLYDILWFPLKVGANRNQLSHVSYRAVAVKYERRRQHRNQTLTEKADLRGCPCHSSWACSCSFTWIWTPVTVFAIWFFTPALQTEVFRAMRGFPLKVLPKQWDGCLGYCVTLSFYERRWLPSLVMPPGYVQQPHTLLHFPRTMHNLIHARWAFKSCYKTAANVQKPNIIW